MHACIHTSIQKGRERDEMEMWCHIEEVEREVKWRCGIIGRGKER